MEENFEDYRRNSGSNGLGIAGFILSLIFCTAIIGLPISIFALKRQPRGLAIAGTVLGAIFVLIQGAVIFMMVQSVRESGWESLENAWEGHRDSTQVVVACQQYFEQNGKYAAELSDLNLAEDVITDPWGHKYRLKYMKSPFDNSYLPLVLSPGRDGVFDNDDDPTKLPESSVFDADELNNPVEPAPEKETPKPGVEKTEENK